MKYELLWRSCFLMETTDDADTHKALVFCEEHGRVFGINSNLSASAVNQIPSSNVGWNRSFNFVSK